MIRILYLIDYLYSNRGGTEKHLLSMLDRLDRRRFEPHLVCLKSTPWYQQANLPCTSEVLECRSLIGPDFIRCGRRLASICKTRRIDVLQTFFRDSNILGMPWARHAGVPVRIASRRSLGAGYLYDRRSYRVAFRILAASTTHYLTNSNAAARDIVAWEGVDPGRISVISNGIDLQEFNPIGAGRIAEIRASWGVPSGLLLIGAMATLRPVKNLTAFVEAAGLIRDRYPRTGFVILGEGPERPALERLIQARGLSDRFFLPGASNHAGHDVQAFDIGVLVSHSESSPNAVLEYMAAGRPSVVVDVGGTTEMVDPGRTALVCPQADLDRFCSSLGQLIEDENLRSRMGQAAQEAVERRFDWTVVLPRLEALYANLVQGASRREVEAGDGASSTGLEQEE
jgi:L-malate glycosyltransferase